MLELNEGQMFMLGQNGKWNKIANIDSIKEYEFDDENKGGYVYAEPDTYTSISLVDDYSIHPSINSLEASFILDMSKTSIKRFTRTCVYGWNSKGPVRKKLLDKVRLYTQDHTRYIDRKEVNQNGRKRSIF